MHIVGRLASKKTFKFEKKLKIFFLTPYSDLKNFRWAKSTSGIQTEENTMKKEVFRSFIKNTVSCSDSARTNSAVQETIL